MTQSVDRIPLFPLNTVLFPGGPVSLRIFEARYLDMVSRCMKEGSGFGVVLIRSGSETGAADVQGIGTPARIRDWDQLEDGLLGITALGEGRFRIESMEQADDGLHWGTVHWLPEPEPVTLPTEHRPLAEWLERIMPELPEPWRFVTPAYDDATWVGYRMAELLPIEMSDKQKLLAMDDPLERLTIIRRVVETLRQTGGSSQ